MEKNEIYTARCVGYTSQGMGIVRLEGRAVFVRGLMEGEEAEIRILKVTASAVYGKIQRLLTASPHRIDPGCPAYGACGGCCVRHMDYEEELRFKHRKVADALRRIGGAELEPEPILGAQSVEGYRNKTIYTVGPGPVTGFYRQRSHDLVAAPFCSIESDYGRRAAECVTQWMKSFSVPAYDERTRRGVRRIMCRYGFGTGQGQTVIVTGRGEVKNAAALAELLRERAPETVSLMQNINEEPGDTILSPVYRTLWGADHITDSLCGLEFELSPGAFYQVNRTQAQRLYDLAVEKADLGPEDTVLDLFCGTGTITLCMARQAKRAIGVEIVEAAVENARENARRNGVENAEFFASDAAETARLLKSQGLKPRVIVVDPPRKGLLPGTAEIIAGLEPERVVYVSCDPATLARDVKIFFSLGYAARSASPVDMFPRTEHVETVCLLTHS